MYIIKRTNSDHLDFQKLVLELDKDLAIKNGAADTFFAQYNKIDLIQHVVLAYDAGKAVGCGAIKEYEKETMETTREIVRRRCKKTMRNEDNRKRG